MASARRFYEMLGIGDGKVCRGCGDWKPLDGFYRQPRGPLGRQTQCKVCVRKYKKPPVHELSPERRERRRATAAAAARRYIADPQKRALARARARAWQDRHSEGRKAWNRIADAKRDHGLTPPTHCEGCGATGRIHAHHDDWAKPLEVDWLCPLCHKARHREMKAVSA